MKHTRVRRWIGPVVALVVAGLVTGALGEESSHPNGVLLVARPELTDPNFAETVVLATRHAHGGAVGVILNRPTAVTLAEAFPSHEHLRGRQDVVYHGGPVARATWVVAFRSAERPARVLHVSADVYLGVDPDLLGRLLSQPPPAALRVYAGYAGWAPGQLEAEIHRGGWYVLDPDAKTIFEMDPRTMWPKLLRRATSRSVRATTVPTESDHSVRYGILALRSFRDPRSP